MKARILTTGSYYPKNKITNHDLEKIIDTNDEWIVQRTGIKQRYFSDLTTSEMAYLAGVDALESVNFDKDDIDLIIVATLTPDQLSPSTANNVAEKLGLKKDIPSFDLNAACTGYIYGLKIAQAFIESNMYQNILLIGAEHFSRVLDFNDRSTAVLFGDGAGASIIVSDDYGIVDTQIYNKADTNNALSVHSDYATKVALSNFEYDDYAHVQMKGQDVFRFASSVMVKMIRQCLKKHNLTMDDIKYIVPHQANLRIIEFAAKTLNIEIDKFVINVDRVGNTSAASIPLALDELVKANKLSRNDKVIMVAFGSGMTYGVSLVEF